MEQGLFAPLPPEITTDVLSRLSVRTIALCKCVCKAWHDLLETDGFVDSYHSKSGAALTVPKPATGDSNRFIVFELEDDLDSYNPITEFDFPREARFEGTADDLILLRNSEANVDALYACNPITREFIELHFLRPNYDQHVGYGFGVSKVSRQHKVVRLESESDYCHVYTLGTGRWRRIEAAKVSASSLFRKAFSDGNFYWLVLDSIFKPWICCFDMETERFITVSCPPNREFLVYLELVSLRDSLCAIHKSTDDEIMIWSWKGCGTEKSWRLEYVIDQHPEYVSLGYDVLPLHVLKNGDILLLCLADDQIFCYSIETKAYQEISPLGASVIFYGHIPLLITPSFRSLKRNFGMENVITF